MIVDFENWNLAKLRVQLVADFLPFFKGYPVVCKRSVGVVQKPSNTLSSSKIFEVVKGYGHFFRL